MWTKFAMALLGAASAQAATNPTDKRFTYYEMPQGLDGPCDLSTGPDGNVWVSDFLAPKVARINPVTGAVKTFDIPYTAPILDLPVPGPLRKLAARPTFGCVSQPGEDGKMYFASGVRNQFAQLNLKTMKFKVFDFGNPVGNLQPLNDMWRAPDGMYITQTTANKISHFNYKTSEITDIQLPSPIAGPVGLYLASDGCMWFCEFTGNKMGRLNITSKEYQEFPVPVPLTGPAVTRAETKVNGRRYVWGTGFLGNKMVGIDIDSFEFKLIDLPQPLSFPVENTFDKKGNVWYSSATYATINRLNPRTGKVKSFPQPGGLINEPGLPPRVDIAVHYGPGDDIWFTELAQNRVGRLKLNQ